jgi:hypothetical protein
MSKPVERIRIGAVSASIFKNESTNGPFHTVSIERRYKDDSDEWKSTSSYDLKSLSHLSAVAQLAIGKIAELDGAETPDQEPEQPLPDDDEIPV